MDLAQLLQTLAQSQRQTPTNGPSPQVIYIRDPVRGQVAYMRDINTGEIWEAPGGGAALPQGGAPAALQQPGAPVAAGGDNASAAAIDLRLLQQLVANSAGSTDEMTPEDAAAGRAARAADVDQQVSNLFRRQARRQKQGYRKNHHEWTFADILDDVQKRHAEEGQE